MKGSSRFTSSVRSKSWSNATIKGLYAKALSGEIPFFTGVSDPYEEPLNPELVIESDREEAETSLMRLLSTLENLNYIPKAGS